MENKNLVRYREDNGLRHVCTNELEEPSRGAHRSTRRTIRGADREDEGPLPEQQTVGAEQASIGIVDIRRLSRRAIQFDDGEIPPSLERFDVGVPDVEAANVKPRIGTGDLVDAFLECRRHQVPAIPKLRALRVVTSDRERKSFAGSQYSREHSSMAFDERRALKAISRVRPHQIRNR